jgi:hypothetical protein
MNQEDQTPMNAYCSNDVAPTQYPGDVDSTVQRKPYVRKVWRTVAIVEAVCILLAGLFFAWMCLDIHPKKSLKKMDAVLFNDQGFENLSSVPGYPFTFDVQEDLPFFWSISVNHYGFDVMRHHATGGHSDSYIGNEFVMNDGETIYWTMYDNEGRQDPPPEGKRIFLEAILYSNQTVSKEDSVTKNYIMGYCVIEIFIDDPGGKYSAEMLDSAYYPQRNGKYQDITTEYVREQIEKAKK